MPSMYPHNGQPAEIAPTTGLTDFPTTVRCRRGLLAVCKCLRHHEHIRVCCFQTTGVPNGLAPERPAGAWRDCEPGPFGLCVRTVDNVPKAEEKLGYDQFHHRPVRQLPLLDRKQILAIAAVTDVAINSRHRLVLARDIASRLKLPTRHLEKVLQALTRQRILLSKPGFGYGLAREPHRISAADILRALSEEDEVIGSSDALPDFKNVVIPALVSAEDAGSQVLQRLTIHSLALSAIE
jgi:Rrf2 family iron-sulfur cluster assembly transcriptional regulator